MVYRPYGMAQRWLFLVAFALFGALGIGMIVLWSFRGDGSRLVVGVAWFAIASWNAYWWCWRTCAELEVDEHAGSLRWASTLSRGAVPLAQVRRVRRTRFGRYLALIELRDHRGLIVPVRYGYDRLIRTLSESAPSVMVEM